MANYTKVFTNPYPNGWENLPSEKTPITAESLQEHTDAIENIEDFLNKNPINTVPTRLSDLTDDATHRTVTDEQIAQWNDAGGSDVSWNQLQKSGIKIAEITIEGQKTDVYSPTGGGGASTWNELADKPFETIGDGLSVDEDGVLSAEGGGDANFWEGTLAMFEAEADSIPDGTLLNIKDDKEMVGDIDALVDAINGEPVAPILEVYDDEERIIGTWFGKPLYRKVVVTDLNALENTIVEIPHGINDFEFCIRLNGMLYTLSSSNKTVYPLSYLVGSVTQSNLQYDVVWINENQLRFRSLIARTNFKLSVIIEYTKVGD